MSLGVGLVFEIKTDLIFKVTQSTSFIVAVFFQICDGAIVNVIFIQFVYSKHGDDGSCLMNPYL